MSSYRTCAVANHHLVCVFCESDTQIRDSLDVMKTREASLLANFSTILASFQNSQLILNLGSDQYTEIKYLGRKVEFQYSNRNHQLNPILTQFTAGSRSSFLIISSTSAVHSTYVIRLLSVLHSLSLPETPLSIPMVLQVVSSSLLVLHFTPRTVSLVDMLEEGKQIALQWVPNIEAEAISGMPEVGTD